MKKKVLVKFRLSKGYSSLAGTVYRSEIKIFLINDIGGVGVWLELQWSRNRFE